MLAPTQNGAIPPRGAYFQTGTSVHLSIYQKNPRAHKNKIGTPPPKKPKVPPPLKRGILWTLVFLQKERIFSRRP